MATETPQSPDFHTAQVQLVAANDLREGRDYQAALQAGSRAVDAFLALVNGIKGAEAEDALLIGIESKEEAALAIPLFNKAKVLKDMGN